jgi:hypothetical protein
MQLIKFRFRGALPALLTLLIVLIGCVAPSAPLAGVPISVEACGCFSEQRVSAFYGQGTIDVRGEFTLTNTVSLPANFYSHVRIFGADDRLLADIPVKIEREDKHYSGDLRLQASFSALFAVSLAQVQRIAVEFDRQKTPSTLLN